MMLEYAFISEYEVLSSKMWKVLNIRLEKWSPEKRHIAFTEYEKFFLLAINFQKSFFLPVSSEIDQIWHFCILNTIEYFACCNRFGKVYLHHEPRIESTLKFSNHEYETQAVEWLTSYVKNFGHFTDQTIAYWRVAEAICERKGWTIFQLNAKIDDFLTLDLTT